MNEHHTHQLKSIPWFRYGCTFLHTSLCITNNCVGNTCWRTGLLGTDFHYLLSVAGLVCLPAHLHAFNPIKSRFNDIMAAAPQRPIYPHCQYTNDRMHMCVTVLLLMNNDELPWDEQWSLSYQCYCVTAFVGNMFQETVVRRIKSARDQVLQLFEWIWFEIA